MEAAVEVGEVEQDRAALLAGGRVLVHGTGVALGEAAPYVRAHLAQHGAAAEAGAGGEVAVDVRLAEPFARPVGERGDAVGRQAEQRGDVGGLGAFEDGVPEHGLPPFGQQQVCPGRQGVLQPGEGRVDEGRPGVVESLVPPDGKPRLPRGGLPAAQARRGLVEGGADVEAGVDRAAYGGEEVGAERGLRPSAPADQVEDPGEGLGGDVLGLGDAADELRGQRAARPDVAPVEPPPGGGVALPDGLEQVRIAVRRFHTHGYLTITQCCRTQSFRSQAGD
nr:hypothetical protein [Nonomuraea pusilla]